MALRPSAARWFEIVVPRADAGDAVETLARRGGTQFDWTGAPGQGGPTEPLAEPLARYHALASAYADLSPAPAYARRCCALPVELSAAAALRQIECWRQAAAPLIDALVADRAERETLGRWNEVAAALAGSSLDLGALNRAGPALSGFCLIAPAGAVLPGDALTWLGVPVGMGTEQALLGIVPGERLAALCAGARAAGGRCLGLPDWLEGPPGAVAAGLPARIGRLDLAIARMERNLRALAEAHGVDGARGVLERVDWFHRTARDIRCEGDSCCITGWTSERDGAALERALAELGIRSAVAFVDAPADAPQPSVRGTPAWARPFEVFTDAVGVPGLGEADPTTWVALLVPLLFGYMCGDVGHGAVIAAAGLLLRRETPLWPLLVACGLSASVFGFVYGEVFGFEHLVPALWVRPLDQPLLILLVPVVAGALILTLGVLLHLVATCWNGEGWSKGVADAAQLLVFWGLPLTLAERRFAWLAAAGAVLCLGNRLWSERSALAVLAGLGQLVERSLQLLLNTLSFARVGAFALAHAALESAVLALAAQVESTAAAALIVVAGNLLVILVEGLVVSIQTTRLVLFEFFARFFQGTGRPFLPAGLPPAGRGV